MIEIIFITLNPSLSIKQLYIYNSLRKCSYVD